MDDLIFNFEYINLNIRNALDIIVYRGCVYLFDFGHQSQTLIRT